MSPRITLLDSHDRRLRQYLGAHAAGHERAAVVLFRRLHRPVDGLEDSDRFVATEVVPFEDDWITGSSPSRIDYELRPLRDLFRRCEEEKLVFGFVHNHPTGFADFSEVDDVNERTLLKALTNRNGPDVSFVAMLWTNDEWKARVRRGDAPDAVLNARHVLVLSQPLKLFAYARSTYEDDGLAARQAAAFGQPFVDMVHSLRIGVVGASGTGSPSLTMLARAGVGELVIIDNDKLVKSNLNRVRGAKHSDIGINKAKILADYLRSLGLGTKVASFDALIDLDPEALDALSSCDLILGCTDDQIGREVLNTALYVYAQPLVDMGLGGRIGKDVDGVPLLQHHYARISTILPEHGECLFCQGVIKDVWIRTQYELRANPNLSEQEMRERYLENGGEQAPGVGPFTSAAADYAVATVFDLLRPFRRYPPEVRRDFFKIDFVKMDIRSSEHKADAECPYCGTRHYLLLRERYRLDRRTLGSPHAAF